MGLSTKLLAGIMIIGATAVCVMLFQRLRFGAVLRFIVAVVLIGPHTPGPVPIQQVDQLQSIAELGVVLFLFAVGLEMRPRKIWSMRRLLFGLGSAQMLLTALVLAAYFVFIDHAAWQAAVILGLGFAMSSTAIVMTTLEERGELTSDHGQTSFAVLMACSASARASAASWRAVAASALAASAVDCAASTCSLRLLSSDVVAQPLRPATSTMAAASAGRRDLASRVPFIAISFG